MRRICRSLRQRSCRYRLFRQTRGAARLYLADSTVRSSFIPPLPSVLAGPRMTVTLYKPLTGVGSGSWNDAYLNGLAAGLPSPRELPGWRAEVKIGIRTRPAHASNVACVLPGRDAEAGRAIVISAHYDHLGTGCRTRTAIPSTTAFPIVRHGVPAVFFVPGDGPYEGLRATTSDSLRSALWGRYHMPNDEWDEHFPFEGLGRYADFATEVIRRLDASCRADGCERGTAYRASSEMSRTGPGGSR